MAFNYQTIPEVRDKGGAVLLSASLEVRSGDFTGEDVIFLHQFRGCCEEFFNDSLVARWVSLTNIFLRPGVIWWLRVIFEAVLRLDLTHIYSWKEWNERKK